jgi:hypothetical protein
MEWNPEKDKGSPNKGQGSSNKGAGQVNPSMTFKGEGKVIILGLLKNDDAKDAEMNRMTDHLENLMKETNCPYERLD